MFIETRDLVKTFKNRNVVDHVSVRVETGEIVGLLGPNGAGKTTTFYMIIGLEHPTAGEVYIGDLEVSTLPMHRRAAMGLSYLAQEASIFRRLTVEENLMAILETCVTAVAPSFPAASGGAWRSLDVSPLSLNLSCSTRPLPASTLSPSPIFRASSSI